MGPQTFNNVKQVIDTYSKKVGEALLDSKGIKECIICLESIQMPVCKNKKPCGARGDLRPGLCCKFLEAPIRFRATAATALQRLSRQEQLARLAEICAFNAASLLPAFHFCAAKRKRDLTG